MHLNYQVKEYNEFFINNSRSPLAVFCTVALCEKIEASANENHYLSFANFSHTYIKKITHVICCSLIIKVLCLDMNCKSRYKGTSILGYGKRVIVPSLFCNVKDLWYQRPYPGW